MTTLGQCQGILPTRTLDGPCLQGGSGNASALKQDPDNNLELKDEIKERLEKIMQEFDIGI